MSWTLLILGCPQQLTQQLSSVVSSELMRFQVLADADQHGLERHVEQASLVVIHEDGAKRALPWVCHRIRHLTDAPIIALVDSYDEQVMAGVFEAGANDYLYGHYSPRELLARIRAQLRRAYEYATQTEKTERYVVGDLTVDVGRHQVTVGERTVRLTPKEFDLLRVMAEHCEKALSREQLLQEVWGGGYETNSRTLDVHIGRLRQKIEPDPTCPSLILTVPSYGYKLKA
jgi:DNA-binding response OmpR family regulator